MGSWQFRNVIALGAALILLTLFVTIRRGSHRTDPADVDHTRATVMMLLLAFLVFIAVSGLLYLLFRA